jgi:hypothetical protein
MRLFYDCAVRVSGVFGRSRTRDAYMYAGEGRTGGSTYAWVLRAPKSAGNRSLEICLRCKGGAMPH